ncbi:palmitoyltransferase ZDHHC11 [Bombina bombina]|uniref:palmitoyltransferase ZDHHC11 n=1 Tax=Bombina bombina TaxID=8345 RepID=UPI00235ACACF|nr:palmitoyltransferase ZDHHC11 [Bombina bombina]
MLKVVKMNCHDRRLRQTEPEGIHTERHAASPPQHSRVNGWSLPLHIFQLIAWLLYSYLAIVGFGIYIPLLPYGWKYAAYAIIGVIFVCHLVSHLVAVTIDPAESNVLAKKNYNLPMPIFDKDKHKHVIQNLHCYLCEVSVGSKTKHCSACNKCIADFDHHCKWLNNCVGGKNYWFFFNTVVSAVLGILLIVIVILYVFIQHFVNPAELRMSPQFEKVKQNNTWLVFLPLAPVESPAAGILTVAVITFLLGIVSLILLGHLLVFHIYLLMKKLSTYDYVMQQRIQNTARSQETFPESSQTTLERASDLHNLSFDEPKKDYPVSSRSSAVKYQESMQLPLRQPSVICAEPYDVTSLNSLNTDHQILPTNLGDVKKKVNVKKEMGNTRTSNCAEAQEKSDVFLSGTPDNIVQSLTKSSLENQLFNEIPSKQQPLGSMTSAKTIATAMSSDNEMGISETTNSPSRDEEASVLVNLPTSIVYWTPHLSEGYETLQNKQRTMPISPFDGSRPPEVPRLSL